jgi:hypothetical protein
MDKIQTLKQQISRDGMEDIFTLIHRQAEYQSSRQ